MIRAGFDEAGLGPTLGPLVIAGFATSVGRADGRPRVGASQWGPLDDLRGPLAAMVDGPGNRDGRIEVGDSKKIHVGVRKLARVERTALTTVAWVHGRLPRTVNELLTMVAAPSFEVDGDRRAPWWSTLDEALPIACEREELEALAERLSTCARKAQVRPLWYRADVISAARINRELDLEQRREGTKNTWATHAVLRLAKLAVDELDAPRLAVWCDKAGGRAAYGEPLRRAFPELTSPPMLECLGENRERSHYRMRSSSARRTELGFVMGGDRCDPRISWASILAKYLRELIMRSFNRHFVDRLGREGNGGGQRELRPTAGYPEDAKRFIAELELELGPNAGLERSAWIRSK